MFNQLDKPFSHADIEWRKIEFKSKTMKENRDPQFERICWLMADKWVGRLKKKTAKIPSFQLLSQLKELSNYLFDQVDTMDRKVRGKSHRTATASLPWGWRDSQHWVTVVEELPRAIAKMGERIREERGIGKGGPVQTDKTARARRQATRKAIREEEEREEKEREEEERAAAMARARKEKEKEGAKRKEQEESKRKAAGKEGASAKRRRAD